MSNEYHIPVMLEEVIDALNIKKDGLYYDATLGGSGHSEAILKKGGYLIATDLDDDAINYGYQDSEIIIKIKEIDNKIKIIIKNKCDKIPEYKLKKIFEQFYRVDSSRTSENGGAGLGLAITKKIIEMHNGTIKVRNDDEFIEFEILLP